MGWTPFATTVDDRAVMWASKPVEFTSKRGARDGLVGRQASLRRGRGRAARAGSQDGGWRTADGDARRQPSERRSSVSMTAGGGGRRSATIAVCRCQRPSMSSPRPELARRIRHRESPAPGSTAATLPITGSAAAALPTIVSAALPSLDSLSPHHWIHQGPHRRHRRARRCRRRHRRRSRGRWIRLSLG